MIDTRLYTEEDFQRYEKRISVLPQGVDGPTPIELASKMVSKINVDWSNPNLRILEPDCRYGSFLFSIYLKLKEFHSDEHIFNNMLFGICRSKGRVLMVKNKLPIKNLFHDDFLNPSPKLEKILNMKKFDVCIMNPPYTQGAKPLYSYFTRKAFEYSKIIVSVMPIDLNSNHDKLKKLNELINRHQIYISENVSHYFNVGVPNIHYTILDENINNPIVKRQNPLDSLDILYPNRNRIKFIAGNTECGETEEDPNGTDVVYKLLQGDELVIKKIPTEKVKRSKTWTNSKYSVFVNVTPSNGRFNCSIIKDCKMTWTRKVFMVECDSKDSANKMKKWLQSDEIQSEVSKMLKAKNNTYSVSLEMVNRLPFYE